MKNQYSKQGLTVPPSGLRPSSFGAFSRKVRSLTANVLLAIGLLAGPAAAFTHPGIPFTTADLDATKANLNTEPWKSGYASLVAQGQSKLSYVMAGPFASVSRTPDVNLSQWKNDMQAIYNLARMGYYTAVKWTDELGLEPTTSRAWATTPATEPTARRPATF